MFAAWSTAACGTVTASERTVHLTRGGKSLCPYGRRPGPGDRYLDHKEYESERLQHSFCYPCMDKRKKLIRIPRADKLRRTEVANRFMEIIASHGRRFFYHGGGVTRFYVDDRGRVWLVDSYTRKHIYTHYEGRWKGFTNGGTLKSLCEALRDYILGRDEFPMRALGPWPEWVCGGDLWGYGDEAMKKVRDETLSLLSSSAA